MNISIILPTYNSEPHLAKCLDAIFKHKDAGDEVIIVDDASTDSTRRIAMDYDCILLSLDVNKGPGFARLYGQEKSKNNINLYIDSDVQVEPDTIRLVKNVFKKDSEVTAVVGVLSIKTSGGGFYSNYKNLYMNYIFRHCPKEIDFLYGSIFAAKKGSLEDTSINKRWGEDTESGLILSERGGRIVLDDRIQVIHLKKYGLKSLLHNDYRISHNFTILFMKKKGFERLIDKGRFSHTRIRQLASIAVTWISLITALISINVALFFLASSLLLRARFLKFLLEEKGFAFTLKSLAFGIIDEFTMGLGIITGVIATVLKR